MSHKADLWHRADEKELRIRCELCSHRCAIAEGACGICGVRRNLEGTLYSLNYGKLVAAGVDPIEKKPFFHFQPGSKSFSIATAGCNFKCLHCQNYQISQLPRSEPPVQGKDGRSASELPGKFAEPEAIVRRALDEGCKSIAYTYTEPTIFFEYARDCAALAARAGLKNIFVTNGYMTQECVQAMESASGGLWLDAANVDIKSFSDDFYRKVCGAKLIPVLETIERLLACGVWVEVTTLIIPGYNDSEKELRAIARWIARTNPSMPWHISAFYPTYKLMDAPPTPASTIERARAIGLEEGLRYVYSGNLPGDSGESTYCYKCGELLIERIGYEIKKNLIKDSACPYCKTLIEGVEL